MANTNQAIGEMDGAAALPRKNGELVFEAPWEGRAFGMAVALNESGTYEWRSFRDQLVDQIASTEAHGAESHYYEQWLASLEEIAVARGLLTRTELDERTREYESGERDDDDH